MPTLDGRSCHLFSRLAWLNANIPFHPSQTRLTSGLTGLALFLQRKPDGLSITWRKPAHLPSPLARTFFLTASTLQVQGYILSRGFL